MTPSLRTLLTALIPLTATQAATPHPQITITNQVLRATVYLPDAGNAFYKGTRFDHAGMIGSLHFAGHNYFPQWFTRIDPEVHDFKYDGDAIVASPCTAATGPAEEFSTNGKPLGFDTAKAGQTFIKIGVGLLLRPDNRDYDPYRLYPIRNAGSWSVRTTSRSVECQQHLEDPSSGHAYQYRKTIYLAPGKTPRLILAHSLRNLGQHTLETDVYNHNFLYLDQLPPSPGTRISLPFEIKATPEPDAALAKTEGRSIKFQRTFSGEDRIFMQIQGFSQSAADYDVRIDHLQAGAGLRIRGDRPLSRMALWSIRAPISLEPFLHICIEPGEEYQWQIAYDLYTLDQPGSKPVKTPGN
ncbi:MAG: hypothetical protein ACO34E_08400 [Limisphaerales bacterium]|jgi:hypothetical protein